MLPSPDADTRIEPRLSSTLAEQNQAATTTEAQLHTLMLPSPDAAPGHNKQKHITAKRSIAGTP